MSSWARSSGATLVWLAYLDHWKETEDPGLKLACLCTAPAIRNPVSNMITEVIGTFVLVFAIMALLQEQGDGGDTGLGPLIVGLLVLGIGLSLGGPTGYAINPARDLGPRIMHAILPIAGKGSSDWSYAWIPVVAPMIGGALAAVVFDITFRRSCDCEENLMAKYAAAIDQGTTSTRCMIFDHGGQVVSVAQKEHEQIYPKPGWVEHDVDRDLGAHAGGHRRGARAAGASAGDIAGVGITNQRETAVVWDHTTGKPIHNALVWQDTRTDKLVDEYSKDGGQARFQEKVGLPLATYFSGPKIRWILDNVDGAAAKAESGDLLFGNMDTWLIWNLTGGTDGGLHITDVTNASRTMLMDLKTLDWDSGIMDVMGVPRGDAAGDQGLQRGLRRGQVGRAAGRADRRRSG